MNEILKKYKEDFPKYFPEEKYKWQAVKHFQSTWDIEAADFTAMFENATSKTYNLLDSGMHFPRAMILDFCKENSERVRAMFKNLFDENIDLSKRFESFRREADEFLQVFNGTKKNHFQNTNSISVYLWLRFPEKYYIYKYSEIKTVADILSENYKPKKGNVQSVINGFIFYDKIRNFLKADLALIDLLNSNLDETCWDDTELYTLTIDFGFYISRYLKSAWIVAANPKYYDVHGAFNKFSVIDWKQSNQNISEGDTVYIYISDEIKRIEYKTVVLKTNMEKQEIDDSEFQIDNSNYADSKKMQLQLLDSVETEELSFSNLRKNGLKGTLQSPEKITIKLIDYIEQFFGGETMENTNKIDEYVQLLKSNHNIILHGAPGTGKTHLANEIANAMKAEVERVQFHPSYDYTDFVEGLRPDSETSINGQIGFKRMDGVFKEFCKKAIEAIDNGNSKIDNFDEAWENLVNYLDENDNMDVTLLSGKGDFPIELNEYGTGLATRTYTNEERKDWISGKSKFFSKDQLYNIYKRLPGVPMGGHDNYRKAIVKMMKDKFGLKDYVAPQLSPVNSQLSIPYVFIIDEINRGEISKIFGELFFSIDPGYRGKKGAVKTQYANMINNANEFDAVLQKEKSGYGWFFVPENVYIIGTMNDIDRSVESMDFAMRRRFIFKEITAEESAENMNLGDEAKRRMTALNNAISKIDGLGSSYHIGAAYFLKNGEPISTDEDFDELWNLRLESLLTEYLRGTGNEDDIKKLRKAFFSLPDDDNQTEDGE